MLVTVHLSVNIEIKDSGGIAEVRTCFCQCDWLAPHSKNAKGVSWIVL